MQRHWQHALTTSRTNTNATTSSVDDIELQLRPGTHDDAGAPPRIPSPAIRGPSPAIRGTLPPPEARPTSVPNGQQLISNPQAGDNPILGAHFPSTRDDGVAVGA